MQTKQDSNSLGGWSSSNQAPVLAKRNIGALARMGLLRSDTNSYGQLRSAMGGRSGGGGGAGRQLMRPPQLRQMQPMPPMRRRFFSAEKRHLGSLARSGWLQAFRPTRGHRFIRSGRDESDIVGSCDLFDVCLCVDLYLSLSLSIVSVCHCVRSDTLFRRATSMACSYRLSHIMLAVVHFLYRTGTHSIEINTTELRL